MEKEKWYRYKDEVTASWTSDFESIVPGSRRVHLSCTEFYVHSHTPKGVWLATFIDGGKWKWVSKTSKKRYAHPTKEAALEAFRIRKIRQLQHLTHKVAQVRGALFIVDQTGAFSRLDTHAKGMKVHYEVMFHMKHTLPDNMNAQEEEFSKLCRVHDLTFSFSDDHQVWRRGRSERDALVSFRSTLDERRAVQIFNYHVDTKLIEGAREGFHWMAL